MVLIEVHVRWLNDSMKALKHHPLVNEFAERLNADGLAPRPLIVACTPKLARQMRGVIKSRNAFHGESAWLSRRYLTHKNCDAKNRNHACP